MGLFDTLALVVASLGEASIPHMVAGSIASAHHGEARSTQDIDIVIDPDVDRMGMLLARLRSSGSYVGDGIAALADRSQFNVIDTSSGWKVDMIIRKDRPFSREEFRRRQPTAIGAVVVHMVSPEDSILSKLEWAQPQGPSGSSRTLRRSSQFVVRSWTGPIWPDGRWSWASSSRSTDSGRRRSADGPSRRSRTSGPGS